MVYLQCDHQIGTDPVLETCYNEVEARYGEGQEDELAVRQQTLDSVPSRLILHII